MLDVTPLELSEVNETADQAYLDLVGDLHGPNLSKTLARAISNITDVDRLHAYDCADNLRTRKPLCSWAAATMTTGEDLDAAYVTRFHRADPIRNVIRGIEATGPGLLVSLEPKDVADETYRRTFFQRFGIRQRVTLLRPVNKRWLALSMSRSGRLYTQGELQALVAFGRLALPLLATSVTRPGADRQSIPELEKRFETTFPSMPLRERQVGVRTMIGMTAEAIALDLDIATSTVLTYRRRAYQRLDICSAHQLSVLVLR